MRLTLRTMLAYLDDILDAEDRAAIEAKIQTNEQATELMYRIRDVMRRLRLPAPSVMEDREDLDPNTVAEYLDNTLSHDRVPDFERVCLESDSHLAEVAACHQVLTLVLGEPAEVSSENRRKAYGLLSAQAEASEEEETSGNGRDVDLLETPTERHHPKIPDYLRTKKQRSVWPKVLAVTALLLMGAVAITALGPFGEPPTPSGDAADEQALASRDPEPNAPPATDEPPVTSPIAEVTPTDREPIPPKLPEPETPPAIAQPPTVDVEPAVVTEPTTSTVPMTEEPSEPGPEEASLQPEAAPDDVFTALTGREPQTVNARPPIQPEVQVGYLTDRSDVLLQADPKSGAWEMVSDDDDLAVFGNRKLLSLPTFRPTIQLRGEIEVRMIDAACIRTLPPEGEGKPSGVRVEYGRVVIRATGEEQNEFILEVEGLSGRLVLPSSATLVAVDVTRGLGGNADPEKEPSPLHVSLIVSEGEALWRSESAADAVVIPPLSLVTLQEEVASPVPLEQVPDWVLFDTSTVEDQRASELIHGSFILGAEPELPLREIAGEEANDARWLALRSLGWTGDFLPMVALLGGHDLPSLFGEAVIEHLRDAIHRNPATAIQVRNGLSLQYPSDGEILYQMLWRYDDDRLDRDEAVQLVDLLEHEELAVRLLAFWNLKRIVGLTFFYRPDYEAESRRDPVQLWRKHIDTLY